MHDQHTNFLDGRTATTPKSPDSHKMTDSVFPFWL